MEFERYAARALDTALQRGASYADLRYERIREERIEVRNGEVATLSDERSSGYGIRAFYEGAWGFAASDDMSNQGVDRTAARAVAIAKASACVANLLDVEKLLHAEQSIRVGQAWIDLWRTEKEFFSTTGSRIEQSIVQSGCGIRALAVSEDDAQERSFPGDIGLYQTGGWEIIEEARLRENATRI